MEKRLYRVEEGKMVEGVCGGVAEYFVAAIIIPVKSEVI